jgi:hypothetical protein
MSESLHDVLVFEVALLPGCLDACLVLSHGCMHGCMYIHVYGLQVLPHNGYITKRYLNT